MPFYDPGHYHLIAYSLSTPMQLTLIKMNLDNYDYQGFFRFSVEIVPSPTAEPAPPSAHLFVFSTLHLKYIL